MRKRNIFNSIISVGNYKTFVDEIISYGRSKVPSYICFANVHMVVEAYPVKAFQKLINEADIVAPDGKPLTAFLRLSEGIKQDRVCGMDIMPDLLKQAETAGESVYFYGSTNGLLKKIIQKAKRNFLY